MHPPVLEFVKEMAAQIPFAGKRILEIGSCDVNGGVRPVFEGCEHYWGIDVVPGPGVDEVVDARDFFPIAGYDIVVSTEAMEHCPHPREIVECAYRSLLPGGAFIATCAAPPRPAHAADGTPNGPHPGEHYRNIAPAEMKFYLRDDMWRSEVRYFEERGDLYAVAYKR